MKCLTPAVRLAFTTGPGGRKKNPTVRLALSTGHDHTGEKTLKGPTVRLALATGGGGGEKRHAKLAAAMSPTVRLAHAPGAQGDNVLVRGKRQGLAHADLKPGILVSFFYLPKFLKEQSRYSYRDWVLDSGAYSAKNIGATINLDDYIATAKNLLANDKTLAEVYALDVIGDYKAGIKNTEKMWKAGVPAIPCYHAGEPWDVLLGLAKDYPKIALGGTAHLRGRAGAKMEWWGQCFARVWPKKIHGFGIGNPEAVLKYPFHSVDATSWETGPCKFGRWLAFGGKMSVRGSAQNLRAEIEFYLGIEKRAQHKWEKDMALLEAK